MQDSTSIATTVLTTNVLAGRQYEFTTRPSRVRLLMSCSAVGVYAYLTAGTSSITDQSGIQVNVAAAAGRLVLPDDLAIEHGVAAGKRLFLTFRNTTGGTLIVYWAVDVDPVR
jgi:hypothetical protein